MAEKIYYSSSPEETMTAGYEFAKGLKPGNIIALNGDLGQGKTVFTKGICSFFRVREYVVSPSYALLNIYNGDVTVYHFDIYRLESEDDLYNIGFFEYVNDSKGIVIVEWAENVPHVFQDKNVIHVTITCEEDGKRKITVNEG